MERYGNYKKYLDEEHRGWKKIKGFQLRYIYLIDKKEKITVPIIPFSKIQEMGAGMYKGIKKNNCVSSVNGSTSSYQDEGNVQIDSDAQDVKN